MPFSNRGALRKSDVREANQFLLLNIIRQNMGTSRADLARITGFSPSSITYIVNRMIRDGLLSEVASNGPSQVGRRPLILQLHPETLLAGGIEITRSGARLAIADLNGSILRKRSVTWQQDPLHFLARVREVLHKLIRDIPAKRLLGVGVSVSGTVHSASGWVRAAENLGWFGVDVGEILSKGISTTFSFDNDAKLGALAERWFAKPDGPKLENFVFLTLQHGLGAGIIIEGRPFHGSSGQGSEFGHTTLFADGRPCVCGGIGCWEEYASERAMERLYRERTGGGPDADPSAERIIALAREGDPIAVDVLRETAQFVGMGLANLNTAFDPEAIIVGGHLAAAWDLMGDWVWETLRHRTPQHYLTNLRIVPSSLGRDSAFKGAIALVLSRFFAGTGQSRAAASSAASAQSRRTR